MMQEESITREGILAAIRINENHLKFYSKQENRLKCWSNDEWHEVLDRISACIERRKEQLKNFDNKK